MPRLPAPRYQVLWPRESEQPRTISGSGSGSRVSMATLTINGEQKSYEAPAEMPLLWVLRDVLGLTGTKFGCGIAQCGACTGHADGKPVRSCLLPVGAV